jgi:hypothetical protein
LKFKYLSGAATGSRFLIPTYTGAVDTGTLVNAYYGLIKKLDPLGKILRTKQNGEIAWDVPILDSELKVVGWKQQYGLAGTGMNGIAAIASKVEETLRYVYRELIHNRVQYGLILILIAWCIRLEIKSRKR